MKKTPPDNPLYFHGRCSGWTEYRYGTADKPTLAPVKKPPPIFSGGKRKHAVEKVNALLTGWQLTHFEKEGVTVAGLRSGLCLSGYGFDRSDAEARSLVVEALRAMGARRPTWEEGQREYVASPDYCRTCRGPLDEESLTSGVPFCSAECAQATYVRREFQERTRRDRAYAEVAHAVQTLRAPRRECAHCGKPFRARYASIYCSNTCRAESDRVLEDRACKQCGKSFRPTNQTTTFCSRPCARRDQFTCAPAVAKSCGWCGETFDSRDPRSIFCGGGCKSMANDARRGKLKRISPRVFDYVFARAA